MPIKVYIYIYIYIDLKAVTATRMDVERVALVIKMHEDVIQISAKVFSVIVFSVINYSLECYEKPCIIKEEGQLRVKIIGRCTNPSLTCYYTE